MAKQDKSPATIMAERMAEVKAQLVPRVAEVMRPVYGNVSVNKKEQRARFWQVEKGWTPEKERLLLTGMNPDGTPAIGPDGQPAKPLSPREVGLLKYPNREIDAKAGGRADSLKMQAEYVREMAEWGPPEPEGLELLAQQAQQQDATPGAGPQAQPSLGRGAPMPAPEMAPPPAVPPVEPMAPEMPPMQGGMA